MENKIIKDLFEINHNIINKNNCIISSWVYYNKENKLCTLSNEKADFYIKNKLVNIDRYYLKFIDIKKTIIITINEIENEIRLIKQSNVSFNKSNELITYISNEIGSYNGLNTFETIWFFRDCKLKSNYLKIIIDKYKFTVKIFDYTTNKEFLVTPKNIKVFLKLNKTKILTIIRNNKKIYKVKMEKLEKQKYEKKIKQLEINDKLPPKINQHATRKVGSRVLSSNIYINRSLKERYETQACKPFPTNFKWESPSSLS